MSNRSGHRGYKFHPYNLKVSFNFSISDCGFVFPPVNSKVDGVINQERKTTTCHQGQLAISDNSPLESKSDNLPQIDRSDRSPQKAGVTTCHKN